MNETNCILVHEYLQHYRVPVYNEISQYLKNENINLKIYYRKSEADISYQVAMFCRITSLFKFYNTIKNADCVICFGNIRQVYTWLTLIICKFNKVPFVSWKHTLNRQIKESRIQNMLHRYLHIVSDAIIAYSEKEAQYVKRVYANKVHVAWNTISYDSIPEVRARKGDLKESLSINTDFTVLFVGRVQKRKRLNDLILVMDLLKDYSITCIIIGGGIEEEAVREIGKRNNIKYMGKVIDQFKVNQYFKAADVFCIPGTCGLGINHAFYWGLPVITEKVLHSPEIDYLENGSNGFLCEVGDVNSIAQCILELYKEHDKYTRMSRHARNTALRYDTKLMSEGFAAAIKYATEKS